jgi:hypothetical protein
MQVNQAFNELRVLNDQPVLRPPSTQKRLVESTTGSFVDVRPIPKQASFGDLLQNIGGTLPPLRKPPATGPSPLGEPPHVDQLETRVRDYRQTLDAVHADLITQLKSAKDTLKVARQSGDQDAITAAQTAINDLNVQLEANRDSLPVVHDDVQGLRELRQQLTADVKAGNLDAIQQDRNAITEQRDQVLADIQA